MAESEATAPPQEVSPEEPSPAVVEAAAPQEAAAAEPAVEPPAAAACAGGEGEGEGEGDHKRKLEEVAPEAAAEADGGDGAKKPRVDGEPDGAGVGQSEEPEVKTEEGAAVAAANGQVAPTAEDTAEPKVEAPEQDGSAPDGGQETTSRKIEVPNSKVGVLIGKSGETIKFLQMNSGAKIQITKDAEADPNAPTRPVEIIGTLESIDKAEQLIKNVIAEADAGGSPALVARGFGSGQLGSEQYEMLVPNDKVGLIIGKNGDTIKSLQTRSGARIQLIPQHPPEGVTMTERTVRVTGNKKQIEAAKEMIKQAMNQTYPRHTVQSGGYGPQTYRPQGPGAASQWGPRSQPQPQPGYGYQQRGMPPPQSMPYSQPYGGYPQQPSQRGGMGWDQRQGPPAHSSHQGGSYDYYRQGSQPYENQPPNYPGGPGAPPANYYNYGQSQAPGYGQPPQYPPSGPPSQNYGHGYSDPKYNAPAPNQQYYGQPPMGPQQGYSQQPDPYARPPYGGGPGNWPPRAAPAGDGGTYQAPPPTSFAPPSQQAPAYGQTYAPAAGTDGYSQQGYPQQGGQASAAYGQGAPAGPVYAQQGAQQGGYAQYPQTQPAYGDQAAPSNMNYGYQGGPTDPNYANTYPQPGYTSAPASGQAGYGQPGYTQPPANPTSYDQSAAPPPQTGYAAPPGNPQAGYA